MAAPRRAQQHHQARAALSRQQDQPRDRRKQQKQQVRQPPVQQHLHAVREGRLQPHAEQGAVGRKALFQRALGKGIGGEQAKAQLGLGLSAEAAEVFGVIIRRLDLVANRAQQGAAPEVLVRHLHDIDVLAVDSVEQGVILLLQRVQMGILRPDVRAGEAAEVLGAAAVEQRRIHRDRQREQEHHIAVAQNFPQLIAHSASSAPK